MDTKTEIGNTISKMALHYGVSAKKFKQWLNKIKMGKPENGGSIYTPKEVQEIIEKLGQP